jgi:DnaK suppressor protein
MAAKKPAAKPVKSKKPAAAKAVLAKPIAAKPIVAKPIAAKSAAAKPVAKKPVEVKKTAVVKKSVILAEVPKAKTAARSAAAAPPIAIATRKTPLQPKPVTVPGDDQESPDNLLAGPRNVQPYIAKRGEQYMNNVQLMHFREILQEWKQDLMLEVDRTVSHMKDEAANFPDPNDRATQEEEFSLELRTRDRERKLIRKIDEALSRIEDGSYGYCLETGEQIGIKRLEARPVATLSIEAQERRERREKQYGDRDDRYR